ncbi:MAG: DUF2007 domain-containing protein [Chloroflexi bacterium]|nr:DUF2007 domain-containing protein [Chloroflexota bacterium]
MGSSKPEFTVISTVQGELTARVIKSHLESEGIPVVLSYESVGVAFGVTVDGLGQVRIMVPEEFAEQAREIIRPRETAGENQQAWSG